MIHCIDENDPETMQGQHTIRINLDGYRGKTSCDSEGNDDQPDFIDIDVNIRPGLLESLNDLKKKFQIVAFTASDKLYADAILDFLD